MVDLSNATFIIPLRIESSDRMRNIITLLCFLFGNFNTNVIIKEVDNEPVFLEKVLPFAAHLHVVDALGVDGEGVQMGKGDVDFRMLKEELRIHAPHIQFIPEVWQGHKDKGQGFWDALAFLEEIGI